MNPNMDETQIITHKLQGLRPDICESVIAMENLTLKQLQGNYLIMAK